MQSLCAEPLTTWEQFKQPSFRKIAIFINNFPTPPAIHISFRRLICPFFSPLLLTNHVLFLRRWGKATWDGFGVPSGPPDPELDLDGDILKQCYWRGWGHPTGVVKGLLRALVGWSKATWSFSGNSFIFRSKSISYLKPFCVTKRGTFSLFFNI